MRKELGLSAYDYKLPSGLIAQYPSKARGEDRLLSLRNSSLSHLQFKDISDLLNPGDLLILNNTKVIRARLQGQKDSGGACEIIVERVTEDNEALCLVRASKPIKDGSSINVQGQKITSKGREGQFYKLIFPIPVLGFLDVHGEIPIPTYLGRSQEEIDFSRYQTIYSKTPGAVAAPTAGLHITHDLLEKLGLTGVQVAEITLHVGVGTFQPIRSKNIEDHRMHSEKYEISEATSSLILETKARGAKVVAVGTTVVRALESAAQNSNAQELATSGETELFIKPGFEFKIVDSLITNFHLPKSTLLLMICAFAGYERVMNAYRVAVENDYRFYSYGDAMWLEKFPCSS